MKLQFLQYIYVYCIFLLKKMLIKTCPRMYLYERMGSNVQENGSGHAGRSLCINSFSCPGLELSWQSEVDEVPLLQLLHDKASGKVRGVQLP